MTPFPRERMQAFCPECVEASYPTGAGYQRDFRPTLQMGWDCGRDQIYRQQRPNQQWLNVIARHLVANLSAIKVGGSFVTVITAVTDYCALARRRFHECNRDVTSTM